MPTFYTIRQVRVNQVLCSINAKEIFVDWLERGSPCQILQTTIQEGTELIRPNQKKNVYISLLIKLVVIYTLWYYCLVEGINNSNYGVT